MTWEETQIRRLFVDRRVLDHRYYCPLHGGYTTKKIEMQEALLLLFKRAIIILCDNDGIYLEQI